MLSSVAHNITFILPWLPSLLANLDSANGTFHRPPAVQKIELRDHFVYTSRSSRNSLNLSRLSVLTSVADPTRYAAAAAELACTTTGCQCTFISQVTGTTTQSAI